MVNTNQKFPGDFQLGANVAGFKKVADAMLAQGYVIWWHFKQDLFLIS